MTKHKAIATLIAIILIASVVMFAGCVEEEEPATPILIKAHAEQIMITEDDVRTVLGSEWERSFERGTLPRDDPHMLSRFSKFFVGADVSLGDDTFPTGRNDLHIIIETYDSVEHARREYSKIKHTFETAPGFATFKVEPIGLGDFGIRVTVEEDELQVEHVWGYLFVKNNVIIEIYQSRGFTGDTDKIQEKLRPISDIKLLALTIVQESKIFEFL